MKITKEQFESWNLERKEIEKKRDILYDEESKIKKGFQCDICKEYFEGHSRFHICEECVKRNNRVASITIFEPTEEDNKSYKDYNTDRDNWQTFKFILHHDVKESEGRSDILHFQSKDRKFSIGIHIIGNKLNIFSNKCHILKEDDADYCSMFYLLPNE